MWELLLKILIASQWLSLFFFIGINIFYFGLCLISFLSLPRIVQRHKLMRELPQPHTEYEIPVSLMVTAYNEESVIVESVRSLLQVDYPKYEIVVINDGSTDRTLEVLQEAFDLVSLPVTVRQKLPHKPITEVYRSKSHPILRVICKENGGCKADASNAGIDACEYPLVSPLDADSVLDRDTHRVLVQPFLEDPNTVAAGGVVRIANGCEVSKGVMVKKDIPILNLFVPFQILEYFRSFFLIRVGWAAVNALPIISGAIGLFSRKAVIEVGGYSRKTHAEDLEIILRMHLYFLNQKKPYRIANVPDANCWTEVPQSYSELRKQRVRWHQGFTECLWFNRKLLFHKRGGTLSWISIPFQIVFEAISPAIEMMGFFAALFLWGMGYLSTFGALGLLTLNILLGILNTLMAMLLEEKSFHTYPRTKHLATLLGCALIDNFGYRQLNTLWRFVGLIYWVIGYEEGRAMHRVASSWQGDSALESTEAEAIEIDAQGTAVKK